MAKTAGLRRQRFHECQRAGSLLPTTCNLEGFRAYRCTLCRNKLLVFVEPDTPDTFAVEPVGHSLPITLSPSLRAEAYPLGELLHIAGDLQEASRDENVYDPVMLLY